MDECAHLQIVLNSHLLEDAASLGDVGQARTQQLVGIGTADILAAEGNAAAAGMHQTGHGLQNGALASAVCTDQSHDLTLANFKGNTLDGMDGTVVNMNIVDFQHRCQLLPRYASMTAGLFLISSGVPLAMILP